MLFLVVGCFSNRFAMASCLEALQNIPEIIRLEESLARPPSLPRMLLRNSLGIFIDPYWFPIKVAKALKGGKDQTVWATRVDFVKDGTRAVVGYLLYGLVPDRYVLSIVELHEETDDEFLAVSKDELIVVVDGFDHDEYLDGKRKILVQLLANERKRAGFNVEYVSAKSPYELAVKLNEIRRTKGPIARMDIYTHGVAAGAITIEDGWIDGQDEKSFYQYLNTGIMRKGAMIRFNACLVGRNEKFLRKFGKALMPEGGKVVASKLITVPSGTAELTEYLTERDMPAAADQLQDIVLGKLFNFGWIAYLKAASRRGDSLSPTWDPITEVTID